MQSFGEKIRELRESHDLSLRELAKRIGVTAAFLSDIERGNRYPSDKVLQQLVDVLDDSFENLKTYDRRAPVEELKRLAERDPAYGFALRRVVDEKVDPDELIKFLDESANRKEEGEES